ARLLMKYGRSDLVTQAGLDDVLRDDDAPTGSAGDAEQLAGDLESLGPVFIKLGQLLSSRTDLLPEAYTVALSRLQDDLAPVPYDEIEPLVEEGLGVRIGTAFSEFSAEPMASASLGQVHRATLRSGREVVVKVQRPGVRKQVADDLEVLEEIAKFLDAHTEAGRRMGAGEVIGQFRRSLIDELDYRKEAANLVRLGEILAGRPNLVVPAPVPDYSTDRILTMDYIEGRKLTDIGPLGRLELDGEALARDLFDAYLDQVLVEGFFHADPHPGNVLLTTDGRLGLLDLGMVARIAPVLRDQLIRLLLSLTEGRGEEVARIAAGFSVQLPDFDKRRFEAEVADLVSRIAAVSAGDNATGSLLLQLTALCGAYGLRPPVELTMVGKALLSLDGIARILAPSFNPTEEMREHAMELMKAGTKPSLSGMVGSLMDARDFAEQLPGRINRALESFTDGQFEVRVRAFDEREMLHGLHKVTNRIVTGLVLAALIIGAALLARSPGGPRVMGYPAVAFVLFVAAALCGAWLLISIIVEDHRVKRAPKE
ncbi:MAG: AarF/UbiB family protein, partial [Mycobacteriales bacterium]